MDTPEASGTNDPEEECSTIPVSTESKTTLRNQQRQNPCQNRKYKT